MSEQMVKDWELYEAGKRYNGRLSPSYYDTVNANNDFFAGNQWRNSGETSGLMKPVFNIIKRITTFFVASLTSSDTAIQFEELRLNGQPGADDLSASDVAGAEIDNLFEKFNMDNRKRDALFMAAKEGDVAGHFYFDPTKKPYRGRLGSDVQGEICFELVSGTNVYFGNANNPDTNVQPYIIIRGRDMVQNLQDEAKESKKSKNGDQITEDNEYIDGSDNGGNIEVEADSFGKATYIIKYAKDPKTGTIKASKCVKNAYIYENVDTGLTEYPIAWMVWEKQKDQYHGRALITGIIPNQIFINKMFAMVMYNLMMTAFPKAVYNADYIEGGWSSEIGEALPITGLGADMSIRNVAGYLEAGNMSSQITSVIDMAMSYTKETLGISDASLGNVNPSNTSAIIAVQKSSTIPLDNVRANLYEWLEDIGRILLDMMGTYYGLRPVVMSEEVIDPKTGIKKQQKVVKEFDFSQLKDLWLSMRVDVGEASYWSEVASLQTLDNLLDRQLIDIADYLERLPEGIIPRKQELINEMRERAAAAQQAEMQAAEAQAEQQAQQQAQEAQYEQMASFMESLPPEIQKRLQQLPPDQMEQAVMQLMQQAA